MTHRFILSFCAKGCGGVFVVLGVTEQEKGFFKKRKQLKNYYCTPAVICKNSGGLPFFRVDVINSKRGILWNGFQEKCGRYSSRIVAPRNIPLPDVPGVKRYSPSSTIPDLIFNTAKNIVSRASAPPESFTLTVTDRCALFPSRICELLPLCSTIRIITLRPEKYTSVCEKAMTESGATLILRSSYEPIKKPDIVICCDGAVTSAMSDCAVFAFRKKTCGKIRFIGSGINLTNEHQSFLPEGIDPLDFACALTELCGSREYSASCFADIEMSCRKCASPLPENCILCHIIGLNKPINT